MKMEKIKESRLKFYDPFYDAINDAIKWWENDNRWILFAITNAVPGDC